MKCVHPFHFQKETVDEEIRGGVKINDKTRTTKTRAEHSFYLPKQIISSEITFD